MWNNIQVFAPDMIFRGYDLWRECEPEMWAKIQHCQVLYVYDEFRKTKREITEKQGGGNSTNILWKRKHEGYLQMMWWIQLLVCL